MAYQNYRGDGVFDVGAVFGGGQSNIQMPGFIQEIWSSRIITKLEEKSDFIKHCGREYEGEIKGKGDSVRVFEVDPVNVRAYTIPGSRTGILPNRTGTITYDTMTGSSKVMTITEAEYYGVQIEDLEELLANPKYFNKAVAACADGMKLSTDLWILADMISHAKNGTPDEFGRVGGSSALSGDVHTLISESQQDSPSNIDVYSSLVDLGILMDDELVPDQGRWVYLPSFVYGYLLKDERFVAAGADTSDTKKSQGKRALGSIAGFEIYTLSRKTMQYWTGEFAGPDGLGVNALLLNAYDALVTTSGGSTTHDVYQTIAGVDGAYQFVDALTKNETLRLQDSFATGVRGLHVYGGDSFRPNHLFAVSTSDSVFTAVES